MNYFLILKAPYRNLHGKIYAGRVWSILVSNFDLNKCSIDHQVNLNHPNIHQRHMDGPRIAEKTGHVPQQRITNWSQISFQLYLKPCCIEHQVFTIKVGLKLTSIRLVEVPERYSAKQEAYKLLINNDSFILSLR